MPYPTGPSFASKHNKKLKGAAAKKAADMATAMERAGVPPSIAIPTANKKGNAMMHGAPRGTREGPRHITMHTSKHH